MAAKCSTAGYLGWLLLASCVAPSGEETLQPLVDDRHFPDVLVEGRVLAPPPDFSGNRFVRGWFPWQHEGTPVWVPNVDGAVLEFVNLGDRPRNLQLDTLLLGEAGDFQVEVEVDGEKLGSFALSETVTVSLPPISTRGRVPIRLSFPKAPDPVILDASLDRALPPGEVEVEARRIVQEPHSVVDFARPSPAKARLVGRFEPPAEPGSKQRFALILDRESQDSQVLFEWTGSWLERLRGSRNLSIPLPGESEFLRIRLLAEGSGQAAIWHDLALQVDSTPETPPSLDLPPPPRLVLVYVLDALRADFVDLSDGLDNPTPTLRQLASRGVIFKRHSSVAPNTIPSTKSLFTGQAFLNRGHWKLAEDGPQTLAEAFLEAGYRTAAFSGNGYISEAYGTSRGFEHLADEVVFREYADNADAYNDNAERVQQSALQWLDSLGDEERAFVYLHTIHPHNPYDPPRALLDRFTADIDSEISGSTRTLLDIKHNRLDVDPSDQQRLTELYRGALSYNDQQIAVFLEELGRRYEDREILLIVTSDHGEELFDHGGVLHGYTLYREQLHIPLIIQWPGHLEPQSIDIATDNLDLHESLRLLIDAAPSAAGEGRPFWNLLDRKNLQPPAKDLQFAAASSVKGGIFMVRSERYKLILAPRVGRTFGMGEGRGRGRDAEYVFDRVEDPDERVNLAGSSALEIAWMRSRLDAWIERGKYLEIDEEQPDLDEETRARLRALGYLE